MFMRFGMDVNCDVCFHKCRLSEGQTGFCRARKNEGGQIKCINYGVLTSIALDPIEKKPLARFHPGSLILSVGSFGCNLRCPFCQNFEIAQAGMDSDNRVMAGSISISKIELDTKILMPDKLCELAEYYVPRGNIGLAYTYNEPLTFWEYIVDTGRLVHQKDMVNVLVSNGHADIHILEKVLPYIDAMNIDLKSFSKEIYKGKLGGDLEQVMDFIKRAAVDTHLEITTLIVPGISDSLEDIEKMGRWIASIKSKDDIVWHITRFFPRYKMESEVPTDIDLVYKCAEVGRRYVKYVYTGNC